MLEFGEYKMRPMEEADLERVLNWRNSEAIRSKMFSDHIILMEEHRAWFEKAQRQPIVSHFIFEWGNQPVGYIGYSDIDIKNSTCSSSFYIGEHEIQQADIGLAIEYFNVEYAFEKLLMRKFWGYVFAFNTKVLKLHQYFGYEQEGYLKQHVLKNGVYEDVVIVAIFRDAWATKREQIAKYLFSGI